MATLTNNSVHIERIRDQKVVVFWNEKWYFETHVFKWELKKYEYLNALIYKIQRNAANRLKMSSRFSSALHNSSIQCYGAYNNITIALIQ